eukprot:CAMPEP_0206209268 /NCGR_PEP_ID=MMETSP0166-20121206/16811_1 /ASSEMBLY_ACC=CAM_ASM_000260 /TAXON_ID=95228 /ORGANISM="Vannella robusta, Strain DIVA3 518/3/11/1/6" /LENGTH=300 /DNA_ID=CAMNT_0053630639 /DNA_START=82 /DNA_END=983 /DNA_ORIENTATION=+
MFIAPKPLMAANGKAEQKQAIDHLNKECEFYFCPRQQEGCSWKGLKSQLKAHDDVCEYMIVPCPSNCSATILRSDLELHKNDCQVIIDQINAERQKQREEAKRKREKEEELRRQEIAKREEERRKAQETTGHEVAELVKPAAEEIVHLNIGGTPFVTSKNTLIQPRSSAFFSCILDSEPNWEESSRAGFFLDRNPKSFALMLNFLRSGSAFPQHLSPKELQLLLVEGIFWCMGNLVEEIMRCLQSGVYPVQELEVSGLDVTGRDFSGWKWRCVSFVECKNLIILRSRKLIYLKSNSLSAL